MARAEDVVPTTKVLIRQAFPNDPVMRAIARSESRFNPKARNPTSSAKGLYQIVNGTWKDHNCTGNVLNAEDNIKCAVKLHDKNGTRDWDASKANWVWATHL